MDCSPWNSPGQNTGVGSLSLLQRIFSTQGSNPGLPYFRQILYQLSHKGSPRILEWLAYPFSSRSSRPRNWTGVSCIAGFFTSWAFKKIQDKAVYMHTHGHSCAHECTHTHTYTQAALLTVGTINQPSSPLNLATPKHFSKGGPDFKNGSHCEIPSLVWVLFFNIHLFGCAWSQSWCAGSFIVAHGL